MSSMLEMSQFNANMQVTELLMKTLENAAKELASRCIKEVALKHGLNAEEEIRFLGLENLSLIRKQMAKKSGPKKEKVVKEKIVKEKKSVFPMPFISESVDISGCQGLAFNRGLFTQCSKKRMENGEFCKGCQSEADKNASGCPDCGTVGQRLATGLYEFKDPKGRSPVSYLKVLEKLKLSSEQAVEEAEKQSIEISEEHFQVIDIAKKSKGRPSKKTSGVVSADNITDLFAALTPEAQDKQDSEEDTVKVSPKKVKLSDEEKALKKAALELDRAQKKAEREAKLAIEKAEKDAIRKAEAEKKKAEREAKLAVEKAEREAKRLAEKAEREAKKAQEKALKEAEKANKGKKTSEAVVANPEPVVSDKLMSTPTAAAAATPTPAATPAAKVTVTRISINGVNYLKSTNNILYNPSTKEEVGIYDPVTKTINSLPDDDEEEEEDEEEYEL